MHITWVSFTLASEYSYRVARPLAWLWVCLLVRFRVSKRAPSLPPSSPLSTCSLSLSAIWSRALRNSRAAPGCCERSSEAPARWQPVLRPRAPAAVGATRLRSEEIERGWSRNGKGGSYHGEGDVILQIPSLLAPRTEQKNPFKLFEGA